MANYCRICEQDFASVEAFDWHLPPAYLSPAEARSVHLDAAELRAGGLRQNASGRWTMKDEPSKHYPRGRKRVVSLRKDIWPARLKEAGLA